MKEFFTFTFYLTVFFQCSLYLTSKIVQLETGAAATLHDKKEWHKKAHGKKNESPNWRMLSKRMKNRKRDTMRNLPNDKIRKGEVDNVCMHVCVHVYVCVRVGVCVRTFVHVCVGVGVDAFLSVEVVMEVGSLPGAEKASSSSYHKNRFRKPFLPPKCF